MSLDWTQVPLGRLFERQQRAIRTEDEVVTAFRDGQVALRSRRRSDGYTEAVQEIGYQGIRKGDLVIHAMDAFAGAIGVAEDEGKSSPVYSALTPRWQADPRFYAYYLRHFALSGGITALAQGIRERSTDFRWASAKTVLVPAPPDYAQRQIADYLDRETAELGDFIAELQNFRSLLEERRRGAIAETLRATDTTVRTRVKHLFANRDRLRVPLSAEERGEMQGDVPYYGASGRIDSVDRAIFDEELILVSEDGANLVLRTKPIAFAVSGPSWVNNHAHVLVPPSGHSVLWATLLEGLDVRPVVTGAAQPKLTIEALNNLEIEVPLSTDWPLLNHSLELLEHEHSRAVADIDAAIALAKERRAALITAAVTGQIDVTARRKPVVDSIQSSLAEVR